MATMALPYKHPKTDVFWIRRAVPKSIRKAFGKTEVKRSLGTKDLAEARKLHPLEYDKISQQFEACKRELEREQSINSTPVTAQDDLSVRDINILTARYYNAELQRMQQSKTLGKGDMLMYDLMAIRLDEWRGDDSDAEQALSLARESDLGVSHEVGYDLKSELESVFGDVAEQLIKDAGYLIGRDNPSFQRLLLSLKRLIPRLRQAAIELVHFTGNEPDYLEADNKQLTQPIKRTKLSNSNADASAAVTMEQLFESYCESHKRYNAGRDKSTQKTIKDYSLTVRRFGEFVAGKPVSDITKADILDFTDLLLSLPSRAKSDVRHLTLAKQAEVANAQGLALIAPSTVRKQIMGLSSVLEYACERGLCEVNPVRGATKRLKKSVESRSGGEKQYSARDIQAIFESSLFTGNYRTATGVYGEAVYWLPLLAYYTGARAEELSQLYVADVKQTDGIYYIDINDNAADKSVKNRGSVRIVPIHSHLIELGFIDYVKTLNAEQRVFPKLSQGSGSAYSSRVSKWLGTYFREECGTNRDIKPIHGFRHTFKTMARGSGVAKDVVDTLQGHSSGDVAESYGEYPLAALQEAIEKIPRVSLKK
ncbi:DUF6538 domain-containing protein [Aliidiomarina sp. Khilg15.8]